MHIVNFRDQEMEIYRTTYMDNGNTAVVLQNLEGEMYTIATVNIGGSLPANEAYIKDYSENTGVLDMLINEKIVTARLGSRQSGFVTLERWRLNLNKLTELEEEE